MTDPLEFQLRILIARFVLSRLTFEAFEDRFLATTWGAGDPALRSLSAAVDLRIAEFTNGHLPMRDLKLSLARLNAGTGGVGVAPT